MSDRVLDMRVDVDTAVAVANVEMLNAAMAALQGLSFSNLTSAVQELQSIGNGLADIAGKFDALSNSAKKTDSALKLTGSSLAEASDKSNIFSTSQAKVTAATDAATSAQVAFAARVAAGESAIQNHILKSHDMVNAIKAAAGAEGAFGESISAVASNMTRHTAEFELYGTAVNNGGTALSLMDHKMRSFNEQVTSTVPNVSSLRNAVVSNVDAFNDVVLAHGRVTASMPDAQLSSWASGWGVVGNSITDVGNTLNRDIPSYTAVGSMMSSWPVPMRQIEDAAIGITAAMAGSRSAITDWAGGWQVVGNSITDVGNIATRDIPKIVNTDTYYEGIKAVTAYSSAHASLASVLGQGGVTYSQMGASIRETGANLSSASVSLNGFKTSSVGAFSSMSAATSLATSSYSNMASVIGRTPALFSTATSAIKLQTDAVNGAINGVKLYSASLLSKEQLMRQANAAQAALARGTGTFTDELKKAHAASGDFTGDVSVLRDLMYLAAAAATVFVGAFKLVEIADEFNNLKLRIASTVTSIDDYNYANSRLQAISLQTHQSLESVYKLYYRISEATKFMGKSAEEVTTVINAITGAAALSGATATEAAAGLQQLSQAFASGRLQGDEFRSLMENLPAVATAVYSGMGLSIDEFREKSKQGKITAEEMFKAFTKEWPAIQAILTVMPTTVGMAMTDFSTKVTVWANDLSNAHGVAATLTSVINTLANNLDTLATIITTVLGGAVIYFTSSLLTSMAAGIGSLIANFGALTIAIDKGAAALTAFLVTGAGTSFLTGGIAAVILAIGAAIYFLREKTSESTKELEKQNAELAKIATFGTYGPKVYDDLAEATKKYNEALDEESDVLEEEFMALMKRVQLLELAKKSYEAALAADTSSFATGIQSMLDKADELTKTSANKKIEEFETFAKKVLDALNVRVKEGSVLTQTEYDGLAKLLGDRFTSIISSTGGAISANSTLTTEALEALKTAFSEKAQEISDDIKRKLGASTVQSILDAADDTIRRSTMTALGVMDDISKQNAEKNKKILEDNNAATEANLAKLAEALGIELAGNAKRVAGNADKNAKIHNQELASYSSLLKEVSKYYAGSEEFLYMELDAWKASEMAKYESSKAATDLILQTYEMRHGAITAGIKGTTVEYEQMLKTLSDTLRKSTMTDEKSKLFDLETEIGTMYAIATYWGGVDDKMRADIEANKAFKIKQINAVQTKEINSAKEIADIYKDLYETLGSYGTEYRIFAMKAIDEQVQKYRDALYGAVDYTQDYADKLESIEAALAAYRKEKIREWEIAALKSSDSVVDGFTAGMLEMEDELAKFGQVGYEVFGDLRGAWQDGFYAVVTGDMDSWKAFSTSGAGINISGGSDSGGLLGLFFGSGTSSGTTGSDGSAYYFDDWGTGSDLSTPQSMVLTDDAINSVATTAAGYAAEKVAAGVGANTSSGWLGAAGGALGLAGGAYGLYSGVGNLSKGNYVSGGVQTGLGAYSTYSGAVKLGLIESGAATEMGKTVGTYLAETFSSTATTEAVAATTTSAGSSTAGTTAGAGAMSGAWIMAMPLVAYALDEVLNIKDDRTAAQRLNESQMPIGTLWGAGQTDDIGALSGLGGTEDIGMTHVWSSADASVTAFINTMTGMIEAVGYVDGQFVDLQISADTMGGSIEYAKDATGAITTEILGFSSNVYETATALGMGSEAALQLQTETLLYAAQAEAAGEATLYSVDALVQETAQALLAAGAVDTFAEGLAVAEDMALQATGGVDTLSSSLDGAWSTAALATDGVSSFASAMTSAAEAGGSALSSLYAASDEASSIMDTLRSWGHDGGSSSSDAASSGYTGTMDLPEYASGGIASGPLSGYPVMLHGTEAIIPLNGHQSVASRQSNTVIHVHVGNDEFQSYVRQTADGVYVARAKRPGIGTRRVF